MPVRHALEKAGRSRQGKELLREDTYFGFELTKGNPQVDGLLLAERIREMGIHVPMILLTSIGLVPEGRLRTHFAAVLIKPVKKGKLGRAMAEILMRKRVTPTPTPQPAAKNGAGKSDSSPSPKRDLRIHPAVDADIGFGSGAAKAGASPLYGTAAASGGHTPSPPAKNLATLKLPPPLAAAVAKLPPLKILLAEDNPINQKGASSNAFAFSLAKTHRSLIVHSVAGHLLSKIGLAAEVASNGQEAVDLCRQQVYDIILMDVQMPILDGLAATRFIRSSIPSAAHTKIIGLTANAMKGDNPKHTDTLCLAEMYTQAIEIFALRPGWMIMLGTFHSLHS